MSEIPLSKRAAALEDLGFSRNEAILYEQLVKFSSATIQDLAKKTDFSRTLLYYILGQLQASGMVTTEKIGSKTTYSAADPAILHDILKSREDDLARQKASVSQLINSFSGDFRLANNKPGVRYFEGLDGFAEALDDSLSTTETIYTFVDIDALQKYAADVNAAYVKKRRAKQIEKRILMQDTAAAREFIKQLGTQNTDTRLLPSSLSPFKTGMQIYDGKISYFTLREKNISAIIIADPEIYTMHRSMFDYWWKLSGETRAAQGMTAFRSE